MKQASKLFDGIRVKPERDRTRRLGEPACEHPGCALKGEFKAPKGRDHEGQYWRFCLVHVKEYNARYNYFNGMSDDAVASFQKSAIVGHRPTWTMGVKGFTRGEDAHAEKVDDHGDPFELFARSGVKRPAGPKIAVKEGPRVSEAERRAFEKLNLEPGAKAAEIKARYKGLVKRFHPDANGGDRTTEDRFRDIVQAYALLKSAGYCS
ncbi:MAG: J domain-containing protein [Hyphomicrobiales bacterium]|uniref:J domain-containing protein n=1 Tax=Candidatus Raskinella chloraquaticus TaxID=1951219 RepID=UPI000A0A71C1|nr:J domain-containing protein [Hyphomicrobiales bacterium]OQW85310.1 MAG: molecular chaperone DnaJ [Proteobacteria bacterium ST_bin15]